MANGEVYTSKNNGSLWILPNGPNTKPEFLPCHDLEDISESKGSITLIQCINERGEYETLGATIAPPEPTTTTLGTYIGKVADWIETVTCPFGLYVMLGCGKKGVFENWERAMLLDVKAVTNRTRSGLVRKEEDVAAMHTFDIEAAPGVKDFFRLTSAAQGTETLAGDINSVRYLDEVSCWDSCGTPSGVCEMGVMAQDTLPQVLLSPSLSGTSEWTSTAADPFGAAEGAADVAIFKVGRNTTRLLAVRGTTDVAAALEVAYSDDLGATWTSVFVGSTLGEFAVKKGALAVLGAYNIYLASNLGRIYKSEDGGLTWEVKEDANITATAYNAISMLNPNVGYAVGLAGLVVKTTDGGKTWSQVGAAGAGNLFSVYPVSSRRVWVGGALGQMYYSTDGGATWGVRQLSEQQPVNDMVWDGDYFGVVANGETIKFTINGGYSWEAIEDTVNLLTTNAVSVSVCNTRQIVSADDAAVVVSSI